MRRSSSSNTPPPGARDLTRVWPLPHVRLSVGAAAAVDKSNAVLAGRRWVGWEEDVLSGDNGRRVVHYYLRCAAPRGGGGDGGGGGRERELAVVGTQRGPHHIAYEVHGRFLRSLEAARAPSRLEAAVAAAEASQLRWYSRREVMDWLTSLVSDCTYGSSTMDDRFDEYSFGDNAKFAGIHTSKDLSSTFVGNNSEDFAWLGPASLSKKQQKHYRSFCRRGVTISVHDFVYIMSEEKKRLVAYVEDMYEDIRANNMVLIRWFHKVDEVGDLLPPGVNDREIFFSHSLQDLRVECIDGLSAVLNAQHFEKFQKSAKHSNWQPYLCSRKIDNDNVKPFDITQLQGYSNQEILRTIFNVSSMKVRFKAYNSNKPSSDAGQKRKRNASNDQTVENSASRNAINDQAVENPPSCNEINDQIVENRAPRNAINDQTMENHPTCNAINDQTVENCAPRNAINDQTMENRPPHNAIIDQPVDNRPPHNAINDQTMKNRPPRNATNDQTVEKCPPSGGSGSDLLNCVLNYNFEQQLHHSCRVEVLSQDSGIRGCWFRCLILKRHKDRIKVKYQDLQNADETGNLEEWLLLTRIANPDQLGIRLSGRPMVRPQHSQRSMIPSTVDVGTIVDAWWHDGWWEGIVVQQENEGRIRVYFPGEKRVAEFHEGDLRHSLEWVDNKWNPLKERKDIAYKLLPSKEHGNQVKSRESETRAKPEMQKASLQSNMGDEKYAKPVGQKASLQSNKGDEKSAKPVAQKASLQSNKGSEKSAKPVARKASLQSSQKADGVSAKLAVQKSSLQSREKGDDESAKPDAQKTSLQSREKGFDEPAIPAAEKASLQSGEKGGDVSIGEKIIPDHKRCAADLTDALRSVNLKCDDKTVCEEVFPDHKPCEVDLTDVLKFDNLKWTERKPRGSCGLWGYPDRGSGSSSQGDIKESSPSGDLALENSVPDKEVCKINGEPLFGKPPMFNFL